MSPPYPRTLGLLALIFLPHLHAFTSPHYHRRIPSSHPILFQSTTSSSETSADIPLLSDGQLSNSTFQQLYADHLPSWLLQRCTETGYLHPTRIQELALPTLFQGHDTVVQAETGSGKTLCYVLPALARVDPTRSAVQALIIVPTREL